MTMDSPFDMSVKVTRGPSATITDFSITDAVGITKTFVGEAKKHPTDEYDQQIGDMYSFVRALRAAADYIEVNADEKVRQANEIRIIGTSITELLDLLNPEVRS